MRVVKHRDSENKRLFPYSELETYSDCDDLVVCMSERSLNIILNALKSTEEMRTRLWTDRDGELYTLASDAQFDEFRLWVGNVYNELGSWVMCNEYLERIAIALEAANQHADEQTLNLKDVFEAMGLETSETEADILEALAYLFDLPGIDILPDFKIPKLGFISSFMEGRYRSAHLQLLRDMSISQRGMAVAQGGIDFAALYDTMGETVDSLAVKAGYAGKAYWLWRWVDNDQIPGWAGWVTTISGLLLGSIRGGVYDLIDLLETWVFPDYTTAIEGIQLSCTSTFHVPGCGCGGGVSSGAYGPGTQGPDDSPPSTVPPTGYPPQFPDVPAYNVYKCKASNVLILNLAEMLYQIGKLENIDLSQYSTHDAASAALGIQSTLILYSGGTIPTGLAGWMTEQIMSFLWPYPSMENVGLAIFEGIRLELLSEREDAVCDLYNSSSTSGARDLLETRIDGYIDATSYTSDVKDKAKEMYKALLTNSFLGQLFEKVASINVYSDSSSIDCTVCEGESDYTIQFGIPQSAEGANPFTVELIYDAVAGPASSCGGASTKRVAVIVWTNPVTINSITGLVAPSACGGVAIYNLHGPEGFRYGGNAEPVDITGVTSVGVYIANGGTHEITIEYTVE